MGDLLSISAAEPFDIQWCLLNIACHYDGQWVLKRSTERSTIGSTSLKQPFVEHPQLLIKLAEKKKAKQRVFFSFSCGEINMTLSKVSFKRQIASLCCPSS